MLKTPEDRHRFPRSVRDCMTTDTIGASTGPQIRNRAPVLNSTSITPGAIGNAVIGATSVGTNVNDANRAAPCNCRRHETAGLLVFQPRERPPTQLHQAPSRLQRCAPSRLSTTSGAAEPKSLSRPASWSLDRPQYPLSEPFDNWGELLHEQAKA